MMHATAWKITVEADVKCVFLALFYTKTALRHCKPAPKPEHSLICEGNATPAGNNRNTYQIIHLLCLELLW